MFVPGCSDEGIYIVKAIVSAEESSSGYGVGDFDYITAFCDNDMDPPDLDVAPLTINSIDKSNGIDSVEITVGGDASSIVDVKLDGQLIETIEFPPNYINPWYRSQYSFDHSIADLAEGTHSILAWHTDAAGNQDVAGETILIDYTLPDVVINPIITDIDQIDIITGETTEPECIVYAYDDDSIYHEDISYYAGSHSFRFYDFSVVESQFSVKAYDVYAIDQAGNVRASTFTVIWDGDGDDMGYEWETIYDSCFDIDPDNASNPDNDFDFDGLPNIDEFWNNSSPCDSDTDDDGMGDAWEFLYNTDATIDDTLEDPDNDGLTNLDEYNNGTDPHNPDTDGDGMPDNWEVSYSPDLDPVSDDSAADPDSDGLSNLGEFTNGTDPTNPDTDGDGMSDGWEVANSLDPNADDAMEDLDGDGLVNLGEYNYGTLVDNTDSDEDGMSDGCEVDNAFDPLSPSDAAGDIDGDGRTNAQECQNGTNPRRPIIIILQPLPDTRVSNSTLTVSGKMDYDVDSVTLSPSGTVNVDTESHTFTGTVTLSTSGANDIVAEAFNGSTSLGQDSMTVYYDNNLPSVSIISPTNGTTINATSCIVRATAVDIEDSAQNLIVSINNFQAIYDSTSGNWWAPVLLNPDASITVVEAVAMDRAGNISDPPDSINLNLGPSADPETPPVTLTIYPGFGQLGIAQDVTFDISVSAVVDASSSYSLDFGDGSTPATGSLSSGTASVNHTYACTDTGLHIPIIKLTDSATGLEYFELSVFNVLPAPTVEVLFNLTDPREMAIDPKTQKLYIGVDNTGIKVYGSIFDNPPTPTSPFDSSCDPSSTYGLFLADFENRLLYELTRADDPGTTSIFEGIYLKNVGPGDCTQLSLDYQGDSVPSGDPGGIFVDSIGNIYISFGNPDNRVDVFSDEYEFLYSLGQAEGMSDPSDILMLDDKLNVLDTGNDRVLEYSVSDTGAVYEGTWTAPAWPGLTAPKHLNFTSDEDEILLSASGQVIIMNKDKELLAYPLDGVNLTDPRGADAIDRTDGARVYFVADATGNKIIRYTFQEDEQGPRQAWEGLRTALVVSNIIQARTYIHPLSREWFDDLINRLGPHAPALAQELLSGSELVLRWNTGVAAEFFGFIQVDVFGTGPQWIAAPIRFERDENGDWKVVLF